MQEFGVSQTVALLPLSIYVLALGAGPLLAAPISETFGRYVIYLVSPPLGMIFTLGAGFSKNIATFIILRFFAGLFFSPALAVGAGTNADMFPPIKRAIPTAFYVLTPFLGPSFG
jgi:MFS family permease